MCYTVKYFVTVPVLYDKWNQELEQTNGPESRKICAKMVGTHSRPQYPVDE